MRGKEQGGEIEREKGISKVCLFVCLFVCLSFAFSLLSLYSLFSLSLCVCQLAVVLAAVLRRVEPAAARGLRVRAAAGLERRARVGTAAGVGAAKRRLHGRRRRAVSAAGGAERGLRKHGRGRHRTVHTRPGGRRHRCGLKKGMGRG
jgi:hypothetical protein